MEFHHSFNAYHFGLVLRVLDLHNISYSIYTLWVWIVLLNVMRFIYVFACIGRFIFIAKYSPLYEHMIVGAIQSKDGRLGCYELMAVMNIF